MTDETGKIIDQYEQTGNGIHSLDAGPPKIPAMVQRETIYETEGTRLRLTCPKYVVVLNRLIGKDPLNSIGEL